MVPTTHLYDGYYFVLLPLDDVWHQCIQPGDRGAGHLQSGYDRPGPSDPL
ncbi:hypothetical protein ACFPFV_06360 [Salinicoccus siamensis]